MEDNDNVIDFTAYKDKRLVPIPSLLEWIEESKRKATAYELARLAKEERKRHNENVIKSWRVNTNEGGKA